MSYSALTTVDADSIMSNKKRYRSVSTGSRASKIDFSRSEKLYLAVAVAESVIVCAIALTVFALIETRVSVVNSKTRTTPVYLMIFILARIFSCVYSFDALRTRSVVQLILHIFFELCMGLYAILQIIQTRSTFKDINHAPECIKLPGGNWDCLSGNTVYGLLQRLMIVPPIVIGLSFITYCFLVRHLYIQFGWAVFRLVSADVELKRIHLHYQIQTSLLKLAAFFVTAFCTAYIILITTAESSKVQYILTIVGFPVTLLTLLVSGIALTMEHTLLMGVTLALMLVSQTYTIYEFATLFLPEASMLYKGTKVTMSLFSVFAIIIFVATFLNGCICMSHFGKGHKQMYSDAGKPNTFAKELNNTHDEEEGPPKLFID